MEENVKKFDIKYILRPVIFVAVLLFCVSMLSVLFHTVLDSKSIRINGYEYEVEDSLDIVAVGNSNLYSSFVPAIMYKEYGYTSYNCGQSEQNLQESYDILKRVFKKQHPSIVILETEHFFVHKNAVLQSMSNDFYSVMNHDNWKDFDKVFTKNGRKKLTLSKGYIRSEAVSAYMDGDAYMTKNNKMKIVMKKKYEKYLNKIVELCKKNGAELLLVKTPSVYTWSINRSRYVSEFADRNNLKFIDFNTNYAESGIDLKFDTRDRGNHLNNNGASKVTRFVGDFIDSNFTITRKNREDKNHWQKCVNNYYC